jgi:quercetin dioxygenase-like cupin family protein
VDKQKFIAALTAEGFQSIVEVARKPDEFVDVHVHPFEAKALILDGEISLRLGQAERSYGIGQVFHLNPQEAHAERCGPAGVTYLVGRKTF